jgi:hypothetical protein
MVLGTQNVRKYFVKREEICTNEGFKSTWGFLNNLAFEGVWLFPCNPIFLSERTKKTGFFPWPDEPRVQITGITGTKKLIQQTVSSRERLASGRSCSTLFQLGDVSCLLMHTSQVQVLPVRSWASGFVFSVKWAWEALLFEDAQPLSGEETMMCPT